MSLKNKKVAVAIAGIDVNIPNWEKIIWGDPKNGVFGRSSRVLTIAHDLNADLLIFNTAASKTVDGILESEYTRQFTLDHLTEVFAENTPEYIFSKQLLEEAFVDTESINTLTKAQVAVRECIRRDFALLIFVSDETHSPRMLRDLIIAKGTAPLQVGVLVSDESFGSPSFIAETPINTTDFNISLSPELQPQNIFRRTLKVSEAKRAEFFNELDQLLKKYNV